jgi:chromosomal replication initiation ATPase DnaA
MRMSPYMYAGLHHNTQRILRSKSCFDTGELDIIARAVCAECNVYYDEFVGRPKHNALSDARKIFYHLCRIRLYRYTCKKLGEYTGKRDHSTVTNAVQRCDELMEVDPMFKDLYVKCWIAATQQLKRNGYEYRGQHSRFNRVPKAPN